MRRCAWPGMSARAKPIILRRSMSFGRMSTVRHCVRSAASESMLAQAMARFSLSARGYHRVLKVARTIADLAGQRSIDDAHVAEAIGYRMELNR